MQGITIEDVAAAGLYAMTQGAQQGHRPPDPRDISECEGLLEVYFKQVRPCVSSEAPCCSLFIVCAASHIPMRKSGNAPHWLSRCHQYLLAVHARICHTI